MRHLAALALLLIPGIACSDWSADERAIYAFACHEAGGTTTLCDCVVKTLEEIQPVAEQVTREDIHAAVQACRLPPFQPGQVSI